jgi:hypothetical protein
MRVELHQRRSRQNSLASFRCRTWDRTPPIRHNRRVPRLHILYP